MVVQLVDLPALTPADHGQVLQPSGSLVHTFGRSPVHASGSFAGFGHEVVRQLAPLLHEMSHAHAWSQSTPRHEP